MEVNEGKCVGLILWDHPREGDDVDKQAYDEFAYPHILE